ncbi:MAG: putative LPS assembly protein LptD, partial [Bacteroidales bacterium]|nr:putative LPS assembly protein LptD [Bacteroidales bacterium]
LSTASDQGEAPVAVKSPASSKSTASKSNAHSRLSAKSNIVQVSDSNAVADSTLNKDSIVPKKTQSISEIVDYEASDSLVFFAGGKGLLYGQGKIVYGEMNLDAGFIQMDMDSSLLYAIGQKDSMGKVTGDPVFKDKSGEYESKSLRYNFKSKKGMIAQAVTQQGEGYVVSGQTKKLSDDIMCMVDGKYTTCDNHEHPHFYLALSKAKVKPGGYIVSGPAHLVMEDVDLPLYLPFGYFPFKGDYASGMLTPTYGDELSRGFYLKDGGYYFAFSDYMDLALTGELYSKGSWGVNARSSYRVKYRYSGGFNASYLETVSSEKNLPDYAKSKNLSVTWSHSQDPKANPYRTFSASVNFQTSGYTRSDLRSYYDPEAFSSNTKSSTVNYTQRFPESPFSLSSSMSISQRSSDSTLTVSVPNLSVSMSSINPLKRKNAVGRERWYEKIRMSYSGSFTNSISQVKEKDFLKKSLIKDWRNGMRHNIPVSATFNVLNYINITPSFNYTERWYSSSIDKYFDEDLNKVVTDTLWGFNRVWDYSASVSASTKIYGMYQPNQKIFGDKINMIRHVITPTVSFSYTPDFGAAKYGYYDDYSYIDSKGIEQKVTYSRYQNSLYGGPGSGESGSINFSLANNLEMKVKQETDTATIFKKISLIDNLSFATSYNMAADSLNWSDISTNIRLKFGSKYTLNLSGSFDPYTYSLNSAGNPVKTNTTQWEKNRIPGRLTGTGTSFSYTFNNETFRKKDKKVNKTDESGSLSSDQTDEKTESQNVPSEKVSNDPEAALYAPFKMPWSLSVSYSLRYARSTFNKEKMDFNYAVTQNMSMSGNIAITDKWKFNASTSYDFLAKKLAMMNCSVSRDLHCWEMTASFIPIGRYKSYNFSVRVKSTLLQDIKYEQHQNPNDNRIWGY